MRLRACTIFITAAIIASQFFWRMPTTLSSWHYSSAIWVSLNKSIGLVDCTAIFTNDVELLAFCLMPNHYHLLIYQQSNDAMTRLMRSIATSYSGYFNRKYKRVGRLFQDVFKASHIR